MALSKKLKFVLTSAAEAELGALFIAAQKMVPLRQTLIEMGWPQPKSPIQTDNTTALGIDNGNVMKKHKAMDMKYHWHKHQIQQKQFYHHVELSMKMVQE